MKTFKLDQNGDVVIKNNQIELVKDIEFVVQTVRQVLNTNLGEWFGDKDEGIDFYVILTKNPDYELVQDTINTAVQKVADSLEIKLETDDFTFNVDGRSLAITFTLRAEGVGETSIDVTL
jgi:hypothetical protein